MKGMNRKFAEAYQDFLELVYRAAEKARRDPAEIKIVAVTKNKPIEKIQEAIDSGIRIFGENYPEELAGKLGGLRLYPDIEWHMIGHLQGRKIKILCEHFSYYHSLDRVTHAEKLNKVLADQGKFLPALLEINSGDEDSKHGWQIEVEDDYQALLRDVEFLAKFPMLRIEGLMTMPPFTENGEKNRRYFKKLRTLQDRLRVKFPHLGWNELSMGTSSDFQQAIEEGATFIRVGTAIFGPHS